ncbi:hypothetical protein CRG98_019386 [Punica granatum]|uniref:Uncharacterized protein n=1 Tax=Punica granatum TaxID=22663 RepID=A0A2I0JV52_PUNGR|nr:hypothetical protein CRG98_019386 [Punica granatum]
MWNYKYDKEPLKPSPGATSLGGLNLDLTEPKTWTSRSFLLGVFISTSTASPPSLAGDLSLLCPFPERGLLPAAIESQSRELSSHFLCCELLVLVELLWYNEPAFSYTLLDPVLLHECSSSFKSQPVLLAPLLSIPSHPSQNHHLPPPPASALLLTFSALPASTENVRINEVSYDMPIENLRHNILLPLIIRQVVDLLGFHLYFNPSIQQPFSQAAFFTSVKGLMVRRTPSSFVSAPSLPKTVFMASAFISATNLISSSDIPSKSCDFQGLAPIHRITIIQQFHIVFGNLGNKVPCGINFSKSKFVVILFIQHMKEVTVERTDVVQARELNDEGSQLLVENSAE